MRVVNVEKEYMKIKFKSNDDLLLNKILELYVLAVVLRSVLEEDAKDYSYIFLDECLYDLQVLEYDRTDITEGIDIDKQMHQKNVIFVILGTF